VQTKAIIGKVALTRCKITPPYLQGRFDALQDHAPKVMKLIVSMI
jgi:hypothetical protein